MFIQVTDRSYTRHSVAARSEHTRVVYAHTQKQQQYKQKSTNSMSLYPNLIA